MIRVVKYVSAKTYKGKDGKEKHYVNYFIVATMENGKVVRIPFTPKYELDNEVYKKLEFVAELVNANE